MISHITVCILHDNKNNVIRVLRNVPRDVRGPIREKVFLTATTQTSITTYSRSLRYTFARHVFMAPEEVHVDTCPHGRQPSISGHTSILPSLYLMTLKSNFVDQTFSMRVSSLKWKIFNGSINVISRSFGPEFVFNPFSYFVLTSVNLNFWIP